MNAQGSSGIDWPSVLSRAHRRFAVQLALLAALGAVGAALLLGGGTATKTAIERSDHPPAPPPAEDEQPDLDLEAFALEATAPPEADAEGEEEITANTIGFSVHNEDEVDADEFVVVASTGEKQTFDSLPAGETAEGSFLCSPEEEVTVTIRDQPYNGAQLATCGDTEGDEVVDGEPPGGAPDKPPSNPEVEVEDEEEAVAK